MGAQLFVSNLPPSETEATLTTRFGKFGMVRSIVFDACTRANRARALVEMQSSADAKRAIAGLNLSNFDGRLVSVYLALASAPRIP